MPSQEILAGLSYPTEERSLRMAQRSFPDAEVQPESAQRAVLLLPGSTKLQYYLFETGNEEDELEL